MVVVQGVLSRAEGRTCFRLLQVTTSVEKHKPPGLFGFGERVFFALLRPRGSSTLRPLFGRRLRVIPFPTVAAQTTSSR